MNSGTASLVFLNLPESFQRHLNSATEKTGFQFDPAIPLPVEIEDGGVGFKPEDITIEMIVSGMLRVIAEDKTAEHIFYYQNFVLAVRPSILRELGGAAITKSKNGDFPAAREIITLLKAVCPASPEVLFINAVIFEEEAESLKRSGREQEALAVEKQVSVAYNEALAVESPLPDALFNAAFFYMKQQDFGKAREYFQEYAEITRNKKNDELKRATALKQIRVIEQRQLDDEHYRKAYLLISSRKEEEGMEELRQFLEKRPDVHNAWFMLGWALRKCGRWKDGAAAFRKSLELGGESSDSRNELALCLIELGELSSAKRELEAALTQEPENIKIISNLGALYLKMGDKKTAKSFFRTVLELQPDDVLAKQFLSL